MPQGHGQGSQRVFVPLMGVAQGSLPFFEFCGSLRAKTTSPQSLLWVHKHISTSLHKHEHQRLYKIISTSLYKIINTNPEPFINTIMRLEA